MNRSIIFILMLAAHTAFAAERLTLNSRHITTADGLAGNTIYELIQDGEGFIWMATNNGLSRYDGYSTVNYTSLSSDEDHRLDARIGRIFIDEHNQLLWMSTATYQNACYDLRHARFTDWTGRSDQYRQQNKLMLTSRGMVFYGMNTGATLCVTSEGRQWSKDYRSQDGTMPSNDVLTVIEDDAHNIWLPTAAGIAVLRPDNQTETVTKKEKPCNVIAAATQGKTTYFLCADGRVLGYDTHYKKVLDTVMPAVLGSLRKVNVSFVWQGRWMLFTPDGTYVMNLKDGKFEKPQQWQVNDGLNQGTCEGYHFVANRQGQLWLFPDSGRVTTLDLIPNARYSTNKGWKFHVVRANDGRLFIATYGAGIYVYNPLTEALVHYSAEDARPFLQSDYMLCAITDRQGCIWIGSESTGVYCLSLLDETSVFYTMLQPQLHGWNNSVSAMGLHSDGMIAVCTRDGNIFAYDKDTRQLTLSDNKPVYAKAYMTDRNGVSWIGTQGSGLYVDGVHYTEKDSIHHISSNTINHIIQTNDGRIWLATWGAGLLVFDSKSHKQTGSLLDGNFNEERVNELCMINDKTLWAATNNGIYRIDTKTCEAEAYNTSNGRFPNDEIATLLYDGEGTLWAGTAGNGIVRCSIDDKGQITKTTAITTSEGLSNNSIASLVKDSNGYIWAGTEDGISRINPQTSIVSAYRFSPSLLGNTASSRCAMVTPDGTVLFGTSSGLLTIAPDKQSQHSATKSARSYSTITDLRVNGKSVYSMELLDQSMSYTELITLDHDQNSLTFYFSNFDYNRLHQPAYQFYLEGIDNEWRGLTSENHADFGDLQPGRYTFHLRSLSSLGNWNEETKLTVIIRQPWWNTWWAWIIYLLLLAAAAYYVYRNWRDKFMLHQQMKMDKQMMEFRTSIFTTITHEFRTPLAIIKGAVDKLGEDGSNKAALQTANRGTNRLLRLVNQLMEYRKISTGNLRLQVEQDDIIVFVKNIIQDFWVVAKQKDLQLTFQPFDNHFDMPFDRQLVETIVYNLLSNAVKYTPERGSVTLKIKKAADIIITVEDNGPGISDEKQKELFKPFMHGYVSQGGMGIGLYTAHQMAQIHKGRLDYNRQEHGSLFTLALPIDGSVYSADDYRETGAVEQIPQHDDDQQPVTDIIREMQTEAFNDLTVAIIEDNPEMMDQISNAVGVYFNTVGYSTGQSGLDGILENPPALLLCDVMLPDIDGYEIVKRLRADERTVSMPIIMLTALDDETHQIRAYRAGADDYMVKPCNFRLLIVRAMQLIKWTRPRATDTDAEPALVEGRIDKLFKEKLEIFTAQHLADPTFNIDQLAQMMNMGRTKFYGKVKELMGVSPNKYIQEERMRRAAELLLEGELTVSEIGYKVGFQDPSYFNKCFKAKFGVAPSKYGK